MEKDQPITTVEDETILAVPASYQLSNSRMTVTAPTWYQRGFHPSFDVIGMARGPIGLRMDASVVLSPGIIDDMVRIGDAVNVTVTPGTGELRTGENAPLSFITAKHPEGAWFHTFCFFIPKSIREPLMGDLGEDRAMMAKEGYSRAKIACATVSQVFWLMLWLVKNLVMEILTPLKNRNG